MCYKNPSGCLSKISVQIVKLNIKKLKVKRGIYRKPKKFRVICWVQSQGVLITHSVGMQDDRLVEQNSAFAFS